MGKVPRGKRKVWLVILILFGVIAAVSVGAILADLPGRREIESLVIGDVDFDNLRDGTYVGEYVGTSNHFRDATVEVTISGGKITDVEILKGALDEEGQPAELTGGLTIADLFDEAIASGSLQVDAVSGATLTSKAHLKALENALKQAQAE